MESNKFTLHSSEGSDENYMLCGRSRNDTPIVAATVRPLSSHNSNRPAETTSHAGPSAQPSSSRNRRCHAYLPKNGSAEYLVDDSVAHIFNGDLIDPYVLINYTCEKSHYIVRGSSWNYCYANGSWQFPTPECEPRCSSAEVQGVTISANCYSSETQRSASCSQPVPPGTRATISCRLGYEYDNSEQTLYCGADGRWLPAPRRCSQICGRISEGTFSVAFM